MIYNNDDTDEAVAGAVAERERIYAEQRAREASDLLGGLMTTDKGKPWSEQPVKGARARSGVDLYPRPVT